MADKTSVERLATLERFLEVEFPQHVKDDKEISAKLDKLDEKIAKLATFQEVQKPWMKIAGTVGQEALKWFVAAALAYIAYRLGNPVKPP